MSHEICGITDTIQSELDTRVEVLTEGLSPRQKAAVLQDLCKHLGNQIEALHDADD